MFLSLVTLALILLLSNTQVMSQAIPPTCKNDSECGYQKLCINRVCVSSFEGARCASHFSCPSGMYCSDTLFRCASVHVAEPVLPTRCFFDNECPSGKYCDPQTYYGSGCVARIAHGTRCLKDSQVEPNHVCYLGYARKPCTQASDCASNEYCDKTISGGAGYCLKLYEARKYFSSSNIGDQTSPSNFGVTKGMSQSDKSTTRDQIPSNAISMSSSSFSYDEGDASRHNKQSYNLTSSVANNNAIHSAWSYALEHDKMHNTTSTVVTDHTNRTANVTLGSPPLAQETVNDVPDWVFPVTIFGGISIVVIVVVIVVRSKRNTRLARAKSAQDKEAQQTPIHIAEHSQSHTLDHHHMGLYQDHISSLPGQHAVPTGYYYKDTTAQPSAPPQVSLPAMTPLEELGELPPYKQCKD